MALETLWNGVTLRTPAGRFPLGTDSVALAGFARIARGNRVADLGCGSGAVALMLLASEPGCAVTGIELDPLAAQAARENARENRVNFTVVEGDLRQIETLLPPGQMDAAAFSEAFLDDMPFVPLCYRAGLAAYNARVQPDFSTAAYSLYGDITLWRAAEAEK